jgi:predicted phage terminase large subunit-like protein
MAGAIKERIRIDGLEDEISARATRSDILRERLRRDARDEFSSFRKLIRNNIKWGWWTQEVAEELQKFYEAFAAGERPWLAIEAPPQHGKSWSVTDFIAWLAGKRPQCKTIFGSYSADLGERTNLDIQRIIKSDNYHMVFPDTQIDVQGWMCNKSLIEYAGYSGSFRNTTIDGPINGMELHLGVLDDPFKGRNEANSKSTRDRTWNWFADDFLARFAEDSAMLIIQTRWHIDDILGRLETKKMRRIRVLKYPAISVEIKSDQIDYRTPADKENREVGDALFPQLKSKAKLLENKHLMSNSSWESEYQQQPITVGGGQLPIEKIRFMTTWSTKDPEIVVTCRFWDKAGSETKGSSWTAGVLMHKMRDGRFVVSHVCRGQWLARDREKMIKLWTEADSSSYTNYEVGLEQEPGSGGKESAENTVAMLAGHRVFVDKVTGDKVVRAQPFAAQVQNGNLFLVAGEWCQAYLDEAEVWPQGTMDQIDGSSGAFNRIAKATTFDNSFNWA